MWKNASDGMTSPSGELSRTTCSYQSIWSSCMVSNPLKNVLPVYILLSIIMSSITGLPSALSSRMAWLPTPLREGSPFSNKQDFNDI